MTSNSAHNDLTSKDGHTGADNITARSRYWLGLKNPRIVRVSRAFGGKDRHSKVTTIKGLRDRRVRLSVQTAIQLYDLQDKLGLGQPSKVVDWLLSHSQHEIDKLPPLQMPPNFMQFAPMLASSDGAPAPPPQWRTGEKLKYESNKSKPNAGAASHLLASASAKRSNLGNVQAVHDEMEFLKCVREAPTTDHSSFEKSINGSKLGDAPALANIPFSRLTTHASLPAAVGNLPYATSFYHLETVATNALDEHHFGSHPSKLTEAAASNPNCIQSQLLFCASGVTPIFSSFLDGAELSSKQYHIQMAAAASSNLQLGSIPSHQSADGIAVVRPSPTASYAFRHHYPDS